MVWRSLAAGSLFAAALLLPQPSARAAAPTPQTYVSGFLFAFPGRDCPNGSARLEDEVYQKAGAVSSVVYCTFRAKEFLYPEPCPSGFHETGSAPKDGKQLHRCRAVGR